jgi:hypothetical protein
LADIGETIRSSLKCAGRLVHYGTRAFVAIRFAARGKGSSVPIEGRVYQVAELRECKYYRIAEFSDRDAAWAAYE